MNPLLVLGVEANVRLPKYPKFRWTFRKNAIINDVESRNFLGLWQEGHIVISLPAIVSELLLAHEVVSDTLLIEMIGDVILHEYLHHILYKCKVGEDHHWAIDKIVIRGFRPRLL